MCSSKSNGLNSFGSFLARVALCLLLAAPLTLQAAAKQAKPSKQDKEVESHEGATLDIAVTLAGITAFQDFQEIRAGLLKSEGVSKVVLVAEAPGLISFKVTYAGEAMGLIDKMTEFFPKKYDMREKRLPGGGSEVSISLKQRSAT